MRPPVLTTMLAWIEVKGHSLRIRGRFEGKRFCISLGLKDSTIGRAAAALKLAEVNRDLQAGYFDETLLKYKPRKLGRNSTEIMAVELFKKYSAAMQREKGLAPGSLHRYRAIAVQLEKTLGNRSADRVTETIAKNVTAQMMESLKGQTVKTYLCLLRACIDSRCLFVDLG
jgi:integrase